MTTMVDYLETSFLPTTIFCVFGITLLLLLKRLIRRWNYTLPPGPITLPVIGHVTILDHMSLFDHRDKYGEVSYMNILGNDVVVLNSVEAIRDALKGPTSDAFNDRPETFAKNYIIYKNIALRSPKDPYWKQTRKIFHSLLRQYGEGKVELERVVGQELGVVIDLLGAKNNQVIKIEEYLEPSLINILDILAIGLRHDYNHWRIVNAREGLKNGNVLTNVFVDNVLKMIPIIRFVPFSIGKIIQQNIQIRDQALAYIKYEGLKGVDDETKTGIIHELYRMEQHSEWIDDEIIFGIQQDLISAGFLTTRNTLCTFFLILLHYPDVQTKIQEEIDTVVGVDREPTTADRSDMPYTQAVILELTRYSSIVAMSIPHACSKDTEFYGFTIPRGSTILPNLFRIHHDEAFWKNPWSFDPLRFLDDSGDLVPPNHPNRQNVIAFGIGKRMCMGEVFAKTRIFLYVTYLLQRFTFEAASGDDLPSCDPRMFTSGIVLRPPDYSMKIVKRENPEDQP